MGLRLYRIPFSTNVERVALALAHKGIAVEYVDVDDADRSPVVAISGQELVPVLVDGDLTVAVTDEASASEVTAAGAKPLMVSVPFSKLEEAKKALDDMDLESALGKRAEDAATNIAAGLRRNTARVGDLIASLRSLKQ